MQVIVKDTTVLQEFVGEVEAKQAVALKPKVSGQIIANLVEGGATVKAGQPLFKIDTRDYEALYYNAQANLANARATLSNMRVDVERYKILEAQGAVSRQVLDQNLTAEKQYSAAVAANEALLNKAQNDLNDTLVTSPIDGRIDIQDLSLGNFAQAGVTTLANISSIDPIYVKFNLSETVYLQLINQRGAEATAAAGYSFPVKITLSDGSVYPLAGQVVQVDKGLSGATGTLALKAEFPNPDKILVPGMFARIIAQGNTVKGALLIPQRAVQEILGKTFVTVVGAEGKAESRPVTLGPKHENFQIVEEGLTASDVVIVEGLVKIRPGTQVQATMMQPEELNAPAAK
jgi:membrane fusion protein (multidrug efflux system)